MNLPKIYIGVLALAVAGCQERGQTVDIAKEEQAIRQLDKDFSNAIQSHDLDKLMSLLSPDIISLTHKPDAPKAEGASVVKALNEQFFKETPNSRVQTTINKVVVSKSGDLAYLVGNYHMTYGEVGSQKVDDGRYVFVLRKLNGRWIIDVHGGVGGVWDPPRDLTSQR